MKVGIVGAGSIVKELLSVKNKIEGVSFTSIFTRREEAARVIAEKYSVENVCRSYDELLESCVDIIYIALPNDLHYEYAKRAVEAGKSVVLEKPFTVSYDECRSLIDLSEKNGVFLFEAISNIHTPTVKAVKEVVASDVKIKKAEINFMQRSRRYDDFTRGIIHPVFDKSKCGGALYDLGVYPLHILVYLFGAPKLAKYTPKIEKDVDVSGIIKLKYDGFSAVCNISKCKEGKNGINIKLKSGVIISSSKPNEVCDIKIFGNDGEKIAVSDSGSERLIYEWQDFRDIYKSDDKKRARELLYNTEAVMKLIDDLKI